MQLNVSLQSGGRPHISSPTSFSPHDALGNIVSYQAEAFAQSLRQARLHKGWSQRDLSGKAGIPQAHISRIESGAVDVKVSTLVELARLLDLELVLAPRSSIPAVEALIREAEASHDLRSVRGLANSLQPALRRLRIEHPKSSTTERLATLILDVIAIAPLFQTPGALGQLEDAVAGIRRAADSAGHDLKSLDVAINGLAKIRSGLVHARTPAQTPAYSLDEED
jgi:transcriptional regulator with XRE-family HTH domain